MSYSPQQIAAVLGGEVSGREVLAPGPGHSPKDRSLSIKLDSAAPDGMLVYSFAGDDPLECKDYVRERLGLARWEPQRSGSSGTGAISRMTERISRQVVAKPQGAVFSLQPETKASASVERFNTAKAIAKASSAPADYIYKLADGTPYLRVKRPGFFQAHWNGSTWVNGAPKGPKIPYRLPEMIEAASNGVMDVVVVEGEKDADNLAALGFIATTNSEGADIGRERNSRQSLPSGSRTETSTCCPTMTSRARSTPPMLSRPCDRWRSRSALFGFLACPTKAMFRTGSRRAATLSSLWTCSRRLQK